MMVDGVPLHTILTNTLASIPFTMASPFYLLLGMFLGIVGQRIFGEPEIIFVREPKKDKISIKSIEKGLQKFQNIKGPMVRGKPKSRKRKPNF